MAGYRKSYTLEEDTEILKAIIKNNYYYSLRGVSSWQKIKEELGGKRSWGSLKERFKKTIIFTIDDPKYQLTPEELQKFKTGWEESAFGGKPQSGHVYEAVPLPDAERSSSNKGENTDKENHITNGAEVLSNEQEVNMNINEGTSRRFYTVEEEKKILNYIIENAAFVEVRGNQIWKHMESHVRGRTWQSLRQRFHKHIINNISKFDYGLSEKNIKEIKKGWKLSECKHNQLRLKDVFDIEKDMPSPEDSIIVLDDSSDDETDIEN